MLLEILETKVKLLLRYERYLSPVAFLAGVVIDNLTLTRIDLWINNLVLFLYLVVALGSIVFVNFYEGRGGTHASPLVPLSHFAMQFAFGGLFSGYVVYYTRSASFVASWPFVFILLFLLIGNELFKKHYARLGFQMSVFFTALFSFAIFYLPVLFHKIGDDMFLLSGLVSIAAITLLILFFSRLIPERIRAARKVLLVSIGSIYALMNVFYFTNIIPPVPLSLKEIGVYHSVVPAAGGDYSVSYEPDVSGFYWFKKPNSEFHRAPGEPVYVYSSVFAPTDLTTKIFHRWEYYDSTKGRWVKTDEVSFPITGGRDGGYRGYSMKTNLIPGKWRVSVVNGRGQLLGRVVFVVSNVPLPVSLQEETI